MLSIISFYFFSSIFLKRFFFPLIFLFLAFCFFLSLSLSFFYAFHINPSLLIFNLAFFMNPVDVDNLDAFGFKPKTKTKAQGWSIYLNRTVVRVVWFQVEKQIS